MTARLVGGPDGHLRDRLLLVALEEIKLVGADDLSLRALARKAGVSHQAPIHVFGSRRGLLTALAAVAVDHLAEQMECAATEAEAASGPGPEVVLAIGLTYLEFALEDQALFLLATRTDALDLTDPALRKARDRAWSVLHDEVARAQATGWRADQPTDLLSLLCWSLMQGIGAIYRDALAPEDLTARTPEQLARAVGDLLRD